MAFISATNRKKETHFDYTSEDDTIGQWFSNFSLLRTPFTVPKTAADTFVLSKFFRLLVNYIWSFLSLSTSNALERSKFQASACRQLTSPKSNKKDQSTCNMNMSDYSCGAIKLTNGPNEQIKTDGFS